MTSQAPIPFLTRAQSWEFGIALRERLIASYMDRTGTRARPFLKEVIDELLEEELGVRLREEALPLDRFAQTTLDGGRVEVTVNSRIGELAGVKDVEGVKLVAKGHEAIHVVREMPSRKRLAAERERGHIRPPMIVCRRFSRSRLQALPPNELVAEVAGVAFAIVGEDLMRCTAFTRFHRLAEHGGDITDTGWYLLIRSAEEVGVNRAALTRYLEQRGVFRIVEVSGKAHLLAAGARDGRSVWPRSA